jgi:hypothetical protein
MKTTDLVGSVCLNPPDHASEDSWISDEFCFHASVGDVTNEADNSGKSTSCLNECSEADALNLAEDPKSTCNQRTQGSRFPQG